MGELRKIPNVGLATERDLIAMGYTTIASLKGKRAEELYAEECDLRRRTIDRCQLYLYRAVEYFVNTENPDPEKAKWWYWKDEHVEPAPCGTVCSECTYFPRDCGGCRNIKGNVFWLQYTGGKVCDIYDCCVNKSGRKDCGPCGRLPCRRYELKDPTISDEQNADNLKRQLDKLRKGR